MATGYNGNQVSEVKVNEKNSAFNVGDAVKVTKEDNLPNFEGTIEKKYTNSALIAFKVGKKISQQMFEELNGRYVVNYDHLALIETK